jgi:hypothetical protein
MDKITDLILAAMKQALTGPAEQRLYKSGKLDGLFPGRSGASAEASARALRDQLLDLVRAETKGKTTIEWVKITPKGVNFLHDQESPVQVLRELCSILQTNKEGIPLWIADLQQELQTQGNRLAEQVQRYQQTLEALSRRADEALRRAEKAEPILPDGLLASTPWAPEALAYLERRSGNGAAGPCPLPELFAALRVKHGELSLPSFHDGLRRLHDRRAIHLLPAASGQDLAEPEHALVEGDAVFYFAGLR